MFGCKYKNILNNLLNMFNLMVSKSIPNSVQLFNAFQNILIGSWIMLITVLSIIFCTYLLDYMIKPIPNVIIDSWDDLFSRNDINIMADEYNLVSINNLINEDPPKIACLALLFSCRHPH